MIIINDHDMDYPLVNVYIAKGKSPSFTMGKPIISMAIFHSYAKLPECKPSETFRDEISWTQPCLMTPKGRYSR